MRNRLISTMALALGLGGAAIAQVTAPAPPPGEVAQEVKALERKFGYALVRGDVKALTELLDDSFLDTDDEGNQTDKNGIIAAVKSGDLKLASLQLSGLRIHSFVYAAVVTGKLTQSGTSKGHPVPAAVSFTDTLAMINGTWKVVASHRSAPHSK